MTQLMLFRYLAALPEKLGRAVCLLPFAMIACSSAGAEPRVVVTTKPAHSLVSTVMGQVGAPKLIVEGLQSPHTFTLKPSGARAINEADVFVRVSESLEPFTRKLVGSLPKSVTLITLADAAGVTLLDHRTGGTFEAHAHAGHGEAGHRHHDHADHGSDEAHGEEGSQVKDGHIWLDPDNALAIVDAVAATLAARFPEHAAAFRDNAAKAKASIEAMKSDIVAEIAPVKDRPFILFHDATQYFEHSFGLAAAGSITISPDIKPSAKRLTAVRRKIADLGAVCVFAEPGFQPKLVAAVTEATKARTGNVDAEGALLTAGPELYGTLMRGMARSFAQCLASTS